MDSGDGLNVSAEPGLTHDILVSRTSVYNQKVKSLQSSDWEVQGRRKHRLFRTTYDPNWTSAEKMRRCGPTPALTIFVAYAPTSSYEEEEVEAFYMDLEKFYREDRAFCKVIIGDFNSKVGPRRKPEELHIGTHGLQWNDQGERLSEFIMTRYRNEIDHIIVNKRFCLTDVAVVPKFCTRSDHRLLQERFSFTRREEKAAKFREEHPRTIINWDLFAMLAGFWEDSAVDNIDEEYDRLVEHLHDCAKKAESTKDDVHAERMDPGSPFTLNGTNISECTSFVYLGRELNMMIDLTPELGRRRRAAWGAYKSIEDVVKKTKNTRLCAHLFNTTVLPALTYASETWAFRKQEENAPATLARVPYRLSGQMELIFDESQGGGGAKVMMNEYDRNDRSVYVSMMNESFTDDRLCNLLSIAGPIERILSKTRMDGALVNAIVSFRRFESVIFTINYIKPVMESAKWMHIRPLRSDHRVGGPPAVHLMSRGIKPLTGLVQRLTLKRTHVSGPPKFAFLGICGSASDLRLVT
ncbi:hypothetical protein RB195_021894 [Necator americanus]|uniref:Endonuclease/exonuclease/phosphatase domain-containing protein n=1 Tax=Necator americanus TaxID=51031 RepID=A0ABR1EDC0_NECAM